MRSGMKRIALFGALATAACGGTVVFESDGSGDGGANGDGGGDAVTLAASTSTSTSTTTGVASTGGGSTSASVSVAVSSSVSAAISTGQGGSPSDAPCANPCFGDPGCDVVPPNPGDACATCVQEEADQGTASKCAVLGALGDCCQDERECSEYVNCVLGGGSDCDRDFPTGSARAVQCVYAACGDCGQPAGPL
jgi:hypothetical protein